MKKDSVPSGLFFSLLGRLVTVASGAVVSIVLARAFGTEDFGRWSVAVVYGTLMGAVIEGGLGRILLREGARNPDKLGEQIGLILRGRLTLSAVAIPIALIAAYVMVDDLATWWLVVIIVFSRQIEGLQSSFVSAMYVLDRFRLPNLLEMARRVAILGGTIAIVLIKGPLLAVAIVMLVLIVASTVPLVTATQQLVKIDFSGSLRGLRRDAFWFWLGGVLFWVNGEVDQLMLASMSGEAATGIYAAAVRLVTFTFVIPLAVSNTVIPRLFRSAHTGDQLNLHLQGTALFLCAIGGLAGVELYFVGRPVALLIYGDAYAASGHILVIYGGFMFLHFARMAPAWYLSASDRVALNAVLLGLAAIANVGLNLYLIPTHGPAGAAWATLLSTALLFVVSTAVAVYGAGPRILFSTLLGWAPAGIAAGVHLAAPASWPWFVAPAIVAVGLGGPLAIAVVKMMRGWSPFGLFDQPD